MPYASIATDNAIDKTFDYLIPDSLIGRVQPGSRVKVSFGNRFLEGYVLAISDSTQHTGKMKPILDVIGDSPWLSKTMIRIAYWMANYYIAPIELCLRTMLPAPVRKEGANFTTRLMIERAPLLILPNGKKFIAHPLSTPSLPSNQLWTAGGSPAPSNQPSNQTSDFRLQTSDFDGYAVTPAPSNPPSNPPPNQTSDFRLQTSDFDGFAVAPAPSNPPSNPPPNQTSDFRLQTSDFDGSAVAKPPASSLPPPASDGFAVVPPSDFRLQTSDFDGCAPGTPVSSRQAEILEILEKTGQTALTAFCNDWHVASQTLKSMAKIGLVTITEQTQRRDPMSGRTILPSTPLALTDEQTVAKAQIIASFDEIDTGNKSKPILLHGVTASGKTEVFLQAIAEALTRDKGAIVLVPEIALTPQTIQRFASRFGSVIAVLHSQLSDGERHDEWHRIHTGEARVVVGPRSAIFAPVKNLGIIIIDEEHEPSYKQDETPRYNARDIAVMRGHYEPCTIVLGSATPSLESWNNYQSGKYKIATMTHRAVNMNMPQTSIVDMRSEVAEFGTLPIFSKRLVTAIRRRLELGEQVMLFLNRRGFAPNVICPKCGHAERCDDCSIGMTYHKEDDILRCHMCGAFRKVPNKCPDCGDPNYKYSGIGTQRVESVANRLFPRAKIQRMDADVTSRKLSHEEILGRFRARQIDILIGTQMIAKGLDFPNVTLAGILNADSSLHIADFRAAERTFQLIAQMAGRAGRGDTPGEVLVQTLSPEHPAIQFARTEAFAEFAQGELEERKELAYPPYTHYTCITLRGENADLVSLYAQRLADAIGTSESFKLDGPSPAPLERIKKYWRFQLVIRGARTMFIADTIRNAVTACPPPAGVQIAIDVDALNSL